MKRYSVEPNEPLLSVASSLEEVVALRDRIDVVVVLLVVDLGMLVAAEASTMSILGEVQFALKYASNQLTRNG